MQESRRRPRRYLRAGSAPMATAGGLALLGVGIVTGATLAFGVHRYLNTVDPTTAAKDLPTGLKGVPDAATYNELAGSAKPGMASAGAQLGIAVAGFLLGWLAPWAPVKMILYGVGFGAVGHLSVQLVVGYVLEPMLGVGKGTEGPRTQRMFAHEIKARNALQGAQSGTTGQPQLTSRRGTPVAAAAPGLPVAQPSDRTPHALASMGAALPLPTAAGGGGALPQQPPTRIGVNGGGQQPPPMQQPPFQPQQPLPYQPPTNVQQPAPPPGQLQPGGGAPPPAFGPPTGGGNGGGNGHGAACGTGCACGLGKNNGGAYGEPPASSPHPLWNAMFPIHDDNRRAA